MKLDDNNKIGKVDYRDGVASELGKYFLNL